MATTTLVRRLSKLESGGVNLPPTVGDWSDWGDTPLHSDRYSINHGTLDQFVVGRLCYTAALSLECQSYSQALRRAEPPWFTNPAYLAKPGSKEVVETYRRYQPPAPATASLGAWVDWLYGPLPRVEGLNPWSWRSTPVAKELATAAAIYLVDQCSMPPQIVCNTAVQYANALLRDPALLASIPVPDRLPGVSPSVVVEAIRESPTDPGVTWIGSDRSVEILDLVFAAPTGLNRVLTRGPWPSMGSKGWDYPGMYG